MTTNTLIISRAEANRQQLKQYYTGKPCKHGHVAFRLTSDGGCMECSRLRAEIFRTNRPSYASDTYHLNKETRINYNRAYYSENRQRCIDYNTQYYANRDVKELHLQSCKRWRDANNLHRKIKQLELFESCTEHYPLPVQPKERDLKYWLAGQIRNVTGAVVLNEQFIDPSKTSRIDLLIPELKLAIECKLDSSRWTANHVESQMTRYRAILEPQLYTVLLVSIDGSLGISAQDFVDLIT